MEVQLNRYSGDWEVLHLHHDQPLSLHTSKKRAMSAARYRLRTGFGGEILVLADTGKVVKTVQVEPQLPYFNRNGQRMRVTGRLVMEPSSREQPAVAFHLSGPDELRSSPYTVTLKS